MTHQNHLHNASSVSYEKGWSVIEKVSHFTHAVGRVSGDRGSAVLISLPDVSAVAVPPITYGVGARNRGRKAESQSPNLCTHYSAHGRTGSAATHSPSSYSPGPPPPPPRVRAPGAVAEERARSGGQENDAGNEDGLSPSDRDLPPLGVLLTTSSVFSSREDIAGTIVTFMEQPVAGTAARLGREPRTFSVAVRGDYGFVTSASPESASAVQRKRLRGGSAKVWGSGESSEEEDDEEEEELGYSLVYCEVYPCEEGAGHRTGDGGGCKHRRRRGGGGEGVERGYGSEDGQWSGNSSVSSASRCTTRRRAANGSCSFGTFADDNILWDESGEIDNAATVMPMHNTELSPDDNLFTINPLPVPLLLSSLAPVHEGDTHLIITHVPGHGRKYLVRHVAAVYDDFCEYVVTPITSASPECDAWCSGGPVFNSNGDFIGLHHQPGGQRIHSNDSSGGREGICIRLPSIVKHLFESSMLGLCRSPISETPVNSLAAGEENEDSAEDELEQRNEKVISHPRIVSKPTVGAYSVATAAKRRSVPASQRIPTFEQVYNEYYTGPSSLSLMLHSFAYCPVLVRRILREIVQQDGGSRDERQRKKKACTLPSSAATTAPSPEPVLAVAPSVVGLILEIIDGHPQNLDLVSDALATLSRLCLHEHNVAVFTHVDGVTTVLEVLKEYPRHSAILHWGVNCLLRVTESSLPDLLSSSSSSSSPLAASPRNSEKDRRTPCELFLRAGGLELSADVLRSHKATERQDRHLVKWMSALVSNAIRTDARAAAWWARAGMLSWLLTSVRECTEDSFVLHGLLQLLAAIVAAASTQSSTHGIDPAAPPLKPVLPGGDVTGADARSALVCRKSGGVYAPMPSLREHEFVVLRQAIALESNALWECLVQVCDRESCERYSDASARLMGLCVTTLKTLAEWGLLPPSSSMTKAGREEGEGRNSGVASKLREEVCPRIERVYPSISVLRQRSRELLMLLPKLPPEAPMPSATTTHVEAPVRVEVVMTKSLLKVAPVSPVVAVMTAEGFAKSESQTEGAVSSKDASQGPSHMEEEIEH